VLSCHEFVTRRLFICGVSEHWMSGSDILVDEITGVHFVYIGHPEDDNSKSGKHGVGFMMSRKAFSMWRSQGSRLNRVSPRVISIEITLVDSHKAEVPFFFQHGYATQQNCPEVERDSFWLDMQGAFDLSPVGATRVLTMDINASIGTRQPHEESSVCGFYGLQRVNPAGEKTKDWLQQNGMYAVSTHFAPPRSGFGYGTWKHPRTKGMYQNDHVFVSRGSLKVVKSCRNFAPLVVSDHLLVKAVFRVAAKIQKNPQSEADDLRKLDFDVLRPFTPYYNPVVDGLYREASRFFFHSSALSDLPLCERGERAMILAALEVLEKRHKSSADWYQSFRHRLDPVRDRMYATMKLYMRQRKGKKVDGAIRSAKEQAVAAYNKLKQYCKNVFIQDMLGKADSSLNSKSWTKTGHDIIKECKRGLSKPKKVNESAMRFPSGRMSKGPDEWLQVFAENLGRIFNTDRPVDRRMLAKLPPYCNRPFMEDLPSPREIHIAVRRLKHSAGGIDGVQACMVKSLLRDNDLFFDYLVPMVEEFWVTQRVPAGWEEMKCSMLFKKGDAADPGNYRSIMLIKVTQKIVLIIIGSRLEALIESLDIESQCGYRYGRGCRDAIFAVRLLLKKRKEHQLETWAVFVDLVKAFDTVNRVFLWEVLVRFGCPESFVDRLRAIHKNVIIVLTKDGKEVRFRSEGGVRQGDILGPPLFVLFMAMLCIVRASDKHTSDVALLTPKGVEKIVLHGLKGNEGGWRALHSE